MFLDIDGTLLDHEKKVPDSTKEAIDLLRQKGVHVAIATGRGPSLYKELRAELAIDCHISFNGAYCVYDDRVIYKRSIQPHLLAQLIQFAKQNDHALAFVNEEEVKSTFACPLIVASFDSIHSTTPEVDPEFHLNKDIFQTLLFCREDFDQSYRESIPHLDFVRWHQLSIDVLPKGGSKARGIHEMIKALGYDMENVYAFGDGMNDIEMLQAVGFGVAMGNASDFVKQHAKMVTKSVDEDGVFFGLKKLGLI